MREPLLGTTHVFVFFVGYIISIGVFFVGYIISIGSFLIKIMQFVQHENAM